MAAASLLPLALFVLTSTLTPGGATTLATASGAQFGLRRSLPLLAGLLLAAPHLQLAMQLAGTAYLFWLAWKLGCGRILVNMLGVQRLPLLSGGLRPNSVH